MEGAKIAGTTQQLALMIDEFEVHGVTTNRIIVGGEETDLSEEALTNIRELCAERKIKLDFVPRLIGLTAPQPVVEVSCPVPADVTLPSYFRYKRYFDVVVSLALIFILSPVMILVIAIALIDVGSPAFFWQQRIGLRGRRFPAAQIPDHALAL